MRPLTKAPASGGPFVVAAGLAALFLIAIIGAGIGAGLYKMIAALVLLIPAIFVLMRPDVFLLLFAGLALLVAGSLKYFFGMGQFQWVLSVFGAVLLGYTVMQNLFSGGAKTIPADGVLQLILLWWSMVIFSSAANALPGLDWFVGLRIYLPFFGIFAYVAYCRSTEKLIKSVMLFIIFIAAVQWIFCLYQKLQVVPLRIAGHYPGSPWDSIVGSFGGDKFSGGESGSLGIYLSIVMVIAIALKKNRQVSVVPFLALFVSGFVAMALTESKVIALMIPLGCLLVYREYVWSHPAKFLAGTAVAMLFMVGLLSAYYYLYWQAEAKSGLIESLYSRLFYSFDPNFRASATNLGRVGSLVFWWDKHTLTDNPLTLLVGHGLASAVSASTVIGQGAAAQRYGLMLDVTGASKLLWESGLLGLMCFLSVFAVGFLRAGQMKGHRMVPPWHRAVMSGVEASMVLMPLSIFYEVTVVSSPPMQFVAMFLLGYVVYWWRKTAEASRV